MERWPNLPDRLEIGLERTFQLLEKFQAKATFFVLGYFAQNRPELIRRIIQRDYETGSHGFYHRLVYRQTREEFAHDLQASLEALSPLKNGPVLSYRAPEWSVREDWMFEELQSRGILYDSSLYPVPGLGNPQKSYYPHLIPAGKEKIWEFPPLVQPFFWGNLPLGGGLPLRMIPYPFLKKRIETLNRQGIPAVIYFHPWELDTDIPRMNLFSLRGIAHYAGLSQTNKKLETLLGDFQFTGLEEWAKKT